MQDKADPPPPVGRTWRRLYAIVVLWLALQILAMYIFTEALR